MLVLCAVLLVGLPGVASASELNLSGTWDANYHCEVGWCAGKDFPAPGVVFVQAEGSSHVQIGTTDSGTLSGHVLTAEGGSGGYTYKEVLTISEDGNSWSGTLTDSNKTSGTDTGKRVSPVKRASATQVNCYVPLMAPGAAWECTATVADASGVQPPGTASGSVAFSINAGTTGGFAGASTCSLKPSQSGPTSYCTVLFVPGTEIPIGTPPPITARYGGDATFNPSASGPQSSVVHEEPGPGQANAAERACGASAARVHLASLVAALPGVLGARTAASIPSTSRVVLVGNPTLAHKQHPLKRAPAGRRAIALLKPSRASLEGGVRLFGLSSPLAAGSVISEAQLGLRKPIVLPLKLKESAWVYWEDLEPLARREHPSIVLVLSAKGGRVLARSSFLTYPEINGRPAAFMASHPRRWLLYGRNPGSRHPRRLTKTQVAALTLARRTALAAEAAAKKKAHRADVGHSTLFTLVDHISGGKANTFENEESAISYTFAKHGVATQAVLNVKALSSSVNTAAANGQTNITVFLDGHGMPTEGSAQPTVLLGPPIVHNDQLAGAEGGLVTAADLTAIVQAHPDVKFNFILDSCYSGRFVNPLKSKPNVGTVMTSSTATQRSWSPLQVESEEGPKSGGGRGLVINSKEAFGGLVPSTKQPVSLKTPNGEKLSISDDDSGNGVSPFTTAVVAAVDQAFIGKGPEADLTAVLADARTLEPTYDLAVIDGRTNPSPDPTPSTPQTCPAPLPSETPSGGWFTGGQGTTKATSPGP
jgi:hypothetical protein